MSMQELEQMDKELRHKPRKLYCLGCGRMISENFTGGLWSYTCICRSVMFGSKEGGVMFPSSLICGYKSHSKCKECKTEKEHICRVIKGLFGKKEFKCEDKEIKKVREQAILKASIFASGKYGRKVLDSDGRRT